MVEGPGTTRNGTKLQCAVGKVISSATVPGNVCGADLIGCRVLEVFTIGKELFIAVGKTPIRQHVSRDSGKLSPLKRTGDSSSVVQQDNVIDLTEDDDGNANGCNSHVYEPLTASQMIHRVTDYVNYDLLDNYAETNAMRLHFGMNGSVIVSRGGNRPKIPPWRRQEEYTLRLELVDDEPLNKKTPNATESNTLTHQNQEAQTSKISSFFSRIEKQTPLSNVARNSSRASSLSPANPYALKKSRPSCTPNESKSPNQNMSSHKPISMIIEARNTTVSLNVSAKVAKSKYQRHCSKDACSPESIFSPHDVFTAIRQHPEYTIADAVLNQSLFPGVGNIIKIESLHAARIDPRRFVQSLSEQELTMVVAECRAYTMNWYTTGKAFPKRVYNRTLCETCRDGAVRMQKMGDVSMSRVTFWCERCQPFSTTTNVSVSSNPHKRKVPPADTSSASYGCPKHGTQTVKLCRVKKEYSPNKLRLFYTCRVSKCQFFAWGDGHFPQCTCKKRTILRVSKTAQSGGKWFFCCAKSGWNGKGNETPAQGQNPYHKGGTNSNKGCGHFSWAESNHLAPLASFLNPLL